MMGSITVPVTPPTTAAESVSRAMSQPPATFWRPSPTFEMPRPSQYRRKSRNLSVEGMPEPGARSFSFNGLCPRGWGGPEALLWCAPMKTVPEIPRARSTLLAAGVWLAAGLLLLLLLWRDRPPTPRPADAPTTEFSEARAMPVVTRLAEEIGLRVEGTEGQRRAAEYLAGALRALPGVEVEVQTTSARMTDSPRGTLVFASHVTNVLARIRGESESAVVEVARVLAAGPRPRHSIIIGLNGAEEGWLLGSTAFVEHPWARDVRAFINLEAAGSRGKATLFQGGPGNKWLTEAYARAAPRPYGSVVGQDLFQSGAIHSETDFRVYRDRGGLTGLDMALYQDGYAYHTSLDRVSRLEPGSLQHMGDNTLAVARELAGLDLPTLVDPEPGVYYDLAGLVMVAYGRSTAGWLAVMALLLAVGALPLPIPRPALPPP